MKMRFSLAALGSTAVLHWQRRRLQRCFQPWAAVALASRYRRRHVLQGAFAELQANSASGCRERYLVLAYEAMLLFPGNSSSLVSTHKYAAIVKTSSARTIKQYKCGLSYLIWLEKLHILPQEGHVARVYDCNAACRSLTQVLMVATTW